MTPELNDNEIHIWRFSSGSWNLQKALESTRPILAREELDQLNTYVTDAKKLEFLAGRVCLRFLLSSYCSSILPKDWLIEPDEYGKPQIKNSEPETPFQINISHSAGELIFIISKNRFVGIDIEQIKNQENLLEIAKRISSESEYLSLQSLSGPSLLQKFFELWALKEAFIKGQGKGLSIPLDSFSFDLQWPTNSSENPSEPIYLKSPQVPWQFFLFQPCRGFQGGVAVACEPSIRLKLTNKGVFQDPIQTLKIN